MIHGPTWVHNVVYIKIENGRRGECFFVYRCNCYQKKPLFSYTCPCRLCYKDKDGSPAISPIVHIPQFAACVRPYLHVAYGNIYLSTWKYTHKHNYLFKYLLFDWLAHMTKLD